MLGPVYRNLLVSSYIFWTGGVVVTARHFHQRMHLDDSLLYLQRCQLNKTQAQTDREG